MTQKKKEARLVRGIMIAEDEDKDGNPQGVENFRYLPKGRPISQRIPFSMDSPLSL